MLTNDGQGAVTEAWAAVAGAPQWAEYVPMMGLERFEAGKLEGVTSLNLRIRRFTTLTTKHRIIHGSKTYKIKGISDFGREGDMLLSCEEVV